jgi:hypothetical protein
MAAALNPVVVKRSDFVHRKNVVKHSYGDRIQSSKTEPGAEVIHRLFVRANNQARTEPMNNFGKAIRG